MGETKHGIHWNPLETHCADGEPYAMQSPTAKLHDDPHYSDAYWNEARTIFGRREPGLSYVYDDRMRQWDHAKHEAAWNAAREVAASRTANFYRAYLSAYYGKAIDLPHIMAGVNVSNGYPYLVFGYREAALTTEHP